MSKHIGNLDKNRSCKEEDISVRLIKERLFCHFICHNFSNTVFIPKFPTNRKKRDVIPVHGKKGKTNIDNHQPTLGKLYERCMYDQMYSYFSPIFVKYQCRFRQEQGHNSQNSR